MKYLALILCVFLLTSNQESSSSTKDAIKSFLNSLDSSQKKSVMLDFESEKRKDWHFLPEKSYPRKGLRMDKMNEDQKAKLQAILQASLSDAGYQKTLAIIDLESVLAELENNPSYRDPELYSIAFFGNPAIDQLWAWTFGGHHLALSFTYVNGKLSMSPRFFGANPAVVLSGDKKGLAVLDLEEQGGLDLINSMSEKQRKLAIISDEAYTNIVTENKKKVEALETSGIPVSKMDKRQVEKVRDLINVYLSSIPEELAEERLKKIDEEEFGNIVFAWAGALEQFKAHYYRIQGQSFLIEFDNAQNNSNHIHTVWRDFDGDFGEDLIRLHREAHKH